MSYASKASIETFSTTLSGSFSSSSSSSSEACCFSFLALSFFSRLLPPVSSRFNCLGFFYLSTLPPLSLVIFFLSRKPYSYLHSKPFRSCSAASLPKIFTRGLFLARSSSSVTYKSALVTASKVSTMASRFLNLSSMRGHAPNSARLIFTRDLFYLEAGLVTDDACGITLKSCEHSLVVFWGLGIVWLKRSTN